MYPTSYFQDCAQGRPESEYSQSLIFAGHSSGQITLLEANRYFMKDPKQAHCGLVTGLEISHGWYQIDSRKIGGADRLMSSGSDNVSGIDNGKGEGEDEGRESCRSHN